MNIRKFSRSSLCGGAALGLVMGCSLAQNVSAQAIGATSGARPEARENVDGSGEILVTARKREEALQDVPDSIAAFGSKQIERANINDLQAITTRVPNVSIEKSLSPTSTFIGARGVISTRNGEPAVAVVVDGVQIGSSSEVSQALSDVASIQVLKGPQGALYGRNAIGGAIIVDTKRPTDAFEGKGMLGIGLDGLREFDGAVSGPIADKLYFRVSVSLRDFDGTIYNENLKERVRVAGAQDLRTAKVDFETNKDVRARILWEPSSDTTLDLRVANSDLKAGSYFYRPTFRLEDTTVSFPISGDVASVAIRTLTTASAKLDHDFGFANLTAISAYTRTKERYGVPYEGRGSNQMGDVDFVNQDLINRTLPTLSARDAALLSTVGTNVGAQNFYAIENYSQEVRLTSPGDGRFRWVAGAYILKTKRDDTVRADLTFPGSPPLSARKPNGDAGATNFVASGLLFNTVNKQSNLAWALFGSADYDLTDKLTLTAALRYDVDRRKITRIDGPTVDTNGHGIGSIGTDCTAGVDTGCVPLGFQQKRTYRAAQPKASLAYKPNDDNLLYATYARGFRSGGFNAAGSTLSDDYDKETLDSFEIGGKSTHLDGHMRVSAAVFYQRYKDVQVFEFDGQIFTQSLYNIPKSAIWGLEASVDARPARGLTINGGIGLMDSRINQFNPLIRDRLEAALKSLITNSVALPPGTQAAFNENFEGRKLAKFPHVTTIAGFSYETDISDAARFFARGEYQGYAKRYWWLDNADKQKWTSLVDASIGLIFNKSWEFSLWCKNCTNTRYDTAVEPAEMTLFGGPAKDVSYQGRKLTAGAQVKYGF